MFFLRVSSPRAVKQEKASRNTEMKSKINFIFGDRKIIFLCGPENVPGAPKRALQTLNGRPDAISRSPPKFVRLSKICALSAGQASCDLILGNVVLVFFWCANRSKGCSERGEALRALVWTKPNKYSRFGVGHENTWLHLLWCSPNGNRTSCVPRRSPWHHFSPPR